MKLENGSFTNVRSTEKERKGRGEEMKVEEGERKKENKKGTERRKIGEDERKEGRRKKGRQK